MASVRVCVERGREADGDRNRGRTQERRNRERVRREGKRKRMRDGGSLKEREERVDGGREKGKDGR